MDQKTLSTLLNPIRMRIFQFIQTNGQATTAEIAKELDHVPKPSLYRHLRKMTDVGILGIYGENKIRGVYEKIYEIKSSPISQVQKLVSEKDTEQLLDVGLTFTMSIMMDFAEYLKTEDIDLARDKVGLRTTTINLNDEESQELIDLLYEKLQEFEDKRDVEGRRLRKFSYAFMPVEDKERRKDEK